MIFCTHTKGGRGSLCLGLKDSASVRGEDTYVRLRQLWVFVTRGNASLALLSLSLHNIDATRHINIIPHTFTHPVIVTK